MVNCRIPSGQLPEAARYHPNGTGLLTRYLGHPTPSGLCSLCRTHATIPLESCTNLSGGWSSGGFAANLRISGAIDYGTQQQVG